MSLVAWYPLNGNTINYGVGDANPTITTTPAYVTGKFNKAMSTGAFNWTAEQTKKILNNNEISIAFWLYVNTEPPASGNTSHRLFGNDSKRQFTLFLYPNCNTLHWSWGGCCTSGSTSGVVSNCIPSYQWTHVCVTYKNPTATIYINGVQKSTFSTTATTDSYEYVTNVLINYSVLYRQDLRIYDHALSIREVKELAKGLGLHYGLRGIGANPNLLIKSNGQFYWDYSTVTTTKGILFWRSDTMALEKGVNYTVSFDAKIDTNDNTLYNGLECDLFPDSLPQRNFQFTAADGLTNQWKHFTWTTSSTNDNISSCYLRFFIDFVDSTTGNTVNAPIHVKNIKLEKGSVATPWVPPSTNVVISTNSGVEYDLSGYGNNGTRGTGVSYANDSPRSNVSTSFTSSSGGITKIPCPLSNSSTEFSIACWIYLNDRTTNKAIYNDRTVTGEGIAVFLLNNPNQIRFDDGTLQTTFNYALPATTWTHVVVTRSTTEKKLYINGALQQTVSSVGTLRNVGLKGSVGVSSASDAGTSTSANYFNGNMSDFRIYATALSADDIKELYELSASVDNTGKMYCYSYVEE